MTQHFRTSSFFVFPNDLNHGNTLFGGKMLSEIDCEAAKVARSVVLDTPGLHTVTARFEVDFENPAYQGDEVVLEADVVALGKSSIKIDVAVYVRSGPDRNTWERICVAKTVFVSVSRESGRAIPHGKTM
jgi:acyl-CoA hydrolase